MELQVSVDLPSTLSDSQGIESPQPSLGDVPVSSAKMGTCLLATRHQDAGPSSPVHVISSRQSPDRHNNGNATTKSPGYDLGSMEMWGWSGTLKNWNSRQLELLGKSWRPSTRKVYSSAWKRWLNWCTSHQINPTHPTGSDLARFLSDLYLVQNLSYNTILLHKSAVSTICNPETSGQLSSNVLIKHVLKSIALQNPLKNKGPIWNINDLTSFLEKKRVDENNIFQVQRHTAALLLLCSGRRIHDLTLLGTDSSSYILQNDMIILWPMFGSKTDTADYRQSGWRLSCNSGHKMLNPVHWVNRTKSLLDNRRKSAKCNNLFINITGEPRPASKTIIAGWIKSLLAEAKINASPGSIRSAVASKNWIDNYPLEQILARGNWRTQNTFKKYYQREVMPSANHSSITALFNPVD